MEDLTCSVCSEAFEGGVREPVLLPRCGHAFCRPCLLNLQETNPAFGCPACRSPYSGPRVEDLPAVYTILNLVATYGGMTAQPKVVTWEECQSHGDPVRLWCQPCQEPLCGQCLYDGHMREGHHVLRTQTALDQEKEALESKAARVSRLIEDRRKHLMLEFHEVSLRLADIYRRTRSLGRYSKTVTDVLQATQEVVHVKTLIKNRRVVENLLAKLETSDRNAHVSDLAARTVVTEPGPGDDDGGVLGTESAGRDDLETVVEGRAQDSDTDDDDGGSEPRRVRGQEANASQDDGRDPQASQDDGGEPQVSQDDGNDPQTNQGARDEPDERRRMESEDGGDWWRLNRCSPGGTTLWPRLNWHDFMAQQLCFSRGYAVHPLAVPSAPTPTLLRRSWATVDRSAMARSGHTITDRSSHTITDRSGHTGTVRSGHTITVRSGHTITDRSGHAITDLLDHTTTMGRLDHTITTDLVDRITDRRGHIGTSLAWNYFPVCVCVQLT